jgi:hypothetical protein
MKLFGNIFSAAAIALLASCGGGGGSAGTTTGGTTATVAGFDYVLDKSSIANSGADEATLTATALDANNNPVSGVDFKVGVSSGIYTPTNTSTDTGGKAVGKISLGGNKANRTITVNMSVGGKTKSDTIVVTGSDIALSTVPAAPAPGAGVVLTVKVVDVNGVGISNTPVVLSGSLGFKGSVTTDSTGTATASLSAAPVAVGTYTVVTTASGVSKSRDIQIVGPTGSVPDAVGTISAASLAITPNTIAPNTSGSTTNKAALRAIFQDASNRAIKNIRVRFEIVEPSLGAGEQISTGSATVYTDQNGVATADYIAGTRSSPTNGVVIRACYGLTDASIANGACTDSRTATMTVANAPLSITLGDNNLLEAGANSLTYIKKFDVAVADSAGNAVANAQISASVDLRSYRKADGIGSVGDSLAYTSTPAICANEDTNRNGLLDAGEDVNGNNTIEPRKADVIISYVGGQVTGSNGRATIQVEYPQSVAYWIDYAVKVTTNVAGSEGSVEKVYRTEALEADVENGSFRKPPYGSGACNSPN